MGHIIPFILCLAVAPEVLSTERKKLERLAATAVVRGVSVSAQPFVSHPARDDE